MKTLTLKSEAHCQCIHIANTCLIKGSTRESGSRLTTVEIDIKFAYAYKTNRKSLRKHGSNSTTAERVRKLMPAGTVIRSRT